MKGGKTTDHANINQRKGRSGCINIIRLIKQTERKNTRDEEDFYMIIKRSVHWEGKPLLKVHA